MNDIIQEGLDNGWNVVSASTLLDKTVLEVDIAIIGSGAGGATSAEMLSKQGFNVLIIEEAKLRHQKDFKRPSENTEETTSTESFTDVFKQRCPLKHRITNPQFRARIKLTHAKKGEFAAQ